MRTTWRRRVLALLAAVLVAVLWGSIAQTQFNLAALQDLGAVVPAGVRARTTTQDLIGFGPVYALVVLVAFLLAFPVAAGFARGFAPVRAILFALAGMVGLVVAIRIVDALAPPPVLIAATRAWPGLIAMTLGGAAAGWLYARLTRPAIAAQR